MVGQCRSVCYNLLKGRSYRSTYNIFNIYVCLFYLGQFINYGPWFQNTEDSLDHSRTREQEYYNKKDLLPKLSNNNKVNNSKFLLCKFNLIKIAQRKPVGRTSSHGQVNICPVYNSLVAPMGASFIHSLSISFINSFSFSLIISLSFSLSLTCHLSPFNWFFVIILSNPN